MRLTNTPSLFFLYQIGGKMSKLFSKEYYEQTSSWYFNKSIKLINKEDLHFNSYIDEKGMVIINFSPSKEKQNTFPAEMFIVYDKNEQRILQYICSKCKQESVCDHYLTILKYAFNYLNTDVLDKKEIQIYRNKVLKGVERWASIISNARIYIEGLLNKNDDKIKFHFFEYEPLMVVQISKVLAEKDLRDEETDNLHIINEQMEVFSSEELRLITRLQELKSYVAYKNPQISIRKEDFGSIYSYLIPLNHKILLMENKQKLIISGDSPKIYFKLERSGKEGFRIIWENKENIDDIIIGNTTYLIQGNSVYRKEIPFTEEIQKKIFDGTFIIGKNDLAFFSTIVANRLKLENCLLEFDKDIKLPIVFSAPPTPEFHLHKQDDKLFLRGELRYDEKFSVPMSIIKYPTNLVRQNHEANFIWFYVPDKLKIKLSDFFSKLPSCFRDDFEQNAVLIFRGEEYIDVLKKRLFLYIDPQWKVILSDDLKKEFVYKVDLQPVIEVNSDKELNLLEFDIKYQYEDTYFTHEELRNFFKTNEKFLKLDNGKLIYFNDREAFDSIEKAFRNSRRNGKGFYTLSNNRVSVLNYLFEKLDNISLKKDNYIDEVLSSLVRGHLEKEVAVPPTLNRQLRIYQTIGFHWIKMLENYGFCGILADDMGLGKTLQALTVIKSQTKKPSLIICPKTLIYNWLAEIEKFTPEINCLVYQGDIKVRKNLFKTIKKYDVVIASYSIISNDYKTLQEFRFQYIIIDEAQHIKNPYSQRAQAVKHLSSEFKLALSGTPFENSFTDIWSIFDFLMPGYLKSYSYFKGEFVNNKESDPEKTKLLKSMITPFVLRRKKEDVLSELPDKQEQIVFCNLNEFQAKFYIKVLDDLKAQYENYSGSSGDFINILSGLTRLRQITNHPHLIDNNIKNEINLSGKTETIVEIINDLLDNSRKVLIFSQFIDMLAIIKKHLKKINCEYEYLDGKTVNRQSTIENFNTNDKVRVFLLSLKVGGLGLNLTAADTVLLVEPWWNPMWELQAIDRTHRIGQNKKVMVYRLITKGTIEEKILQLQQRKNKMFKELFEYEYESNILTKEELGQLLGFL